MEERKRGHLFNEFQTVNHHVMCGAGAYLDSWQHRCGAITCKKLNVSVWDLAVWLGQIRWFFSSFCYLL